MGLCVQARKQCRKNGHEMSHDEHRVVQGVSFRQMQCTLCDAVAIVREGTKATGSAITGPCVYAEEDMSG